MNDTTPIFVNIAPARSRDPVTVNVVAIAAVSTYRGITEGWTSVRLIDGTVLETRLDSATVTARIDAAINAAKAAP